MNKLVFYFLTIIFSMNMSADVFHISQKKNSSDENSGTVDNPFLTINHAAQIAKAGDTIIVHSGKYREWVKPRYSGDPENNITYMAVSGERVVVSGSEEISPEWQPLFPDNGQMSVKKADLSEHLFIDNPLLSRHLFNPFKIPLRANSYKSPKERFVEPEWDDNGEGQLVIGEVYVGGIPLEQVRTTLEVTNKRGTFCVSNKGKTIVVNFFKWSGPSIEITVRPYAFAPEIRGVSYITVKGFIFEHATNTGTFPGTGMVSVRSGKHWTIENNIIRYSGMTGLDIGSEVIGHGSWLRKKENMDKDINEGAWAPGVIPPVYEMSWNRQEEMLSKLSGNEKYKFMIAREYLASESPSRGHVVRGNLIYNCGQTGIFLPKCSDSIIESNVVENCNRRYISADRTFEIGWNECAGLKALCATDIIVRHNVFRNNKGKASGIWFDNCCYNNVMDGNIINNNNYGIYLEACSGSIISTNTVCNNIILFNRLDGFNSTDSTTPAIVANNLIAYNGRWGCAIINENRRWGKDNIPAALQVNNNVFIENQRGVFRIPLLNPEKYPNNNFSGNVFAPDAIFQTSIGHRKELQAKDMINEMKGYLEIRQVDKRNWPDFKTWRVSNKWFRGVSQYVAFNAVVPGTNNFEVVGLQAKIYELLNRFRYDDAEGHPVGEHVNLKLGSSFILIPSGWEDTKVKPLAGIKYDFFGVMPSKSLVTPGPFFTMQNNKPINISIINSQK